MFYLSGVRHTIHMCDSFQHHIISYPIHAIAFFQHFDLQCHPRCDIHRCLKYLWAGTLYEQRVSLYGHKYEYNWVCQRQLNFTCMYASYVGTVGSPWPCTVCLNYACSQQIVISTTASNARRIKRSQGVEHKDSWSGIKGYAAGAIIVFLLDSINYKVHSYFSLFRKVKPWIIYNINTTMIVSVWNYEWFKVRKYEQPGKVLHRATANNTRLMQAVIVV